MKEMKLNTEQPIFSRKLSRFGDFSTPSPSVKIPPHIIHKVVKEMHKGDELKLLGPPIKADPIEIRSSIGGVGGRYWVLLSHIHS